MNLSPLLDLAEAWEREAENSRFRGMNREARMAESFAEELRQRISEWEMAALTVTEAAEESGYSESHLRNLLSDGHLRNVGRKGAPRIQRSDLPSKANSGPGPQVEGLVAEALRRRGG